MTIERFAGCQIRGTSNDIKPSHAGLVGFIFREIDTGSVFYHNGTQWLLISGPNKAEELKNKTIDLDQGNTLQNMVVSPFVQSFKRVGHLIPVSANPHDALHNGCLAGWHHMGTPSFTFNTAVNRWIQGFTTSSSDVQLGYLSDNTMMDSYVVTRREFSPYFKVQARVTNTTAGRFLIGFSTQAPLPLSNTVIPDTESGVLVGYISGGSGYYVRHNDGSGPMVNTPTGIPLDTDWHEIEISMTSESVTAILDDGAGDKTQVLTTKIPDNDTDIYLHCVLQTAGTGLRDIQIAGGEFRSDK